MLNSTERPPCAECGNEVDPDEAHWAHKPGARSRRCAVRSTYPERVEVREALDACDCDLLVHPNCCPDCREEEA